MDIVCSANTTEYVRSSSKSATEGAESEVKAASRTSEECNDSMEQLALSATSRDSFKWMLDGLLIVRGGGEDSCSWNVSMVREA